MTGLLRVADVAYDVVDTLGPGRRTVVWVQGCTIACEGCMVPESWTRRAGRLVHPGMLASELFDSADGTRRGADLTVSGGEPTEQAGAVAQLLAGARDRGGTTWVYTGRTYEDLLAEGAPDVLRLLQLVDVLVDGPYELGSAGGVGYRGSRNQRILRLTDAFTAEVAESGRVGALDLRLGPMGITVIGVPQPGALAALEQGLAERGVAVRGVRRAMHDTPEEPDSTT